MRNSKRLLSVLLVVVLMLSTILVSSLSAIGEEERTVAYYFEDQYYDSTAVSALPDSCYCNNDGSVTFSSDRLSNQYQVMFKVAGDYKTMLADAIEESCDRYNGALTALVTVESAKTNQDLDCRPRVQIMILGATSAGKPDYENVIAKSSDTQIPPNIQTPRTINLTPEYLDNGYNGEAKFVYVKAECYNWGCGNGKGTKDLRVTCEPLYVDNGITQTTKPRTTNPPDPDQTTFFKFESKLQNDYDNGPDDNGIAYDADGSVYLAKESIEVEQMQVNYKINTSDEDTINGYNLAKSSGTNLLKINVTLEKCVYKKQSVVNGALSTQYIPTIAEVDVMISTKMGDLGNEKPADVGVTAWQYPGSTRTYYLDISGISDISELSTVTVRVQNYWYYDTNNKLFDYDTETNYAGELQALKKGYTKARIQAVAYVSPISVVKDATKTYTNTTYDLVLNDLNANGGNVPSVITLKDANATYNNQAPVVNTTTAAVKPAIPTIKSAALSATTKAKITWGAAKNATNYEIYRKVGSGSYKLLKTVSKSTLTYTDTVAAGKTYYYKVRAKNSAGVSGFSSAKTVKVLNYSGKPTIKLTAGSKKFTVKVSTKVTNATKYQVQYSTSSKFTSKKTTTMTTSKTISSLTSKKTYYVRVRAYTKIGSKYYYSKWSTAAKKVTVK